MDYKRVSRAGCSSCISIPYSGGTGISDFLSKYAGVKFGCSQVILKMNTHTVSIVPPDVLSKPVIPQSDVNAFVLAKPSGTAESNWGMVFLAPKAVKESDIIPPSFKNVVEDMVSYYLTKGYLEENIRVSFVLSPQGVKCPQPFHIDYLRKYQDLDLVGQGEMMFGIFGGTYLDKDEHEVVSTWVADESDITFPINVVLSNGGTIVNTILRTLSQSKLKMIKVPTDRFCVVRNDTLHAGGGSDGAQIDARVHVSVEVYPPGVVQQFEAFDKRDADPLLKYEGVHFAQVQVRAQGYTV